MGSIGIISLTTRRNRRFIQSAETFQLLRCGALSRSGPPDGAAEADPSPSDPLVGGLHASVDHTDQGFDLGTGSRGEG
jgi:hypothetical protein